MAKLVVLKLDGDLEYQGLRVTLEIGCENARPEIELMANLPKSPELISLLDCWQNKYRQIGVTYRIKPKKITYDGSINKRIEECRNSAKELRDVFSSWLNCSELNEINKRLREELNRQENIRLLIRTEDSRLQKLPWHLWDFIERYPNAEIALSSAKFERLKKLTYSQKSEVKILAILGHKEGIDIAADRQLLENLPLTKTVFLVEPEHQEINDKLWEESWDIIFFAGHSETKGETGKIYINPTDSLTIDELWYGLRKAVDGGLKLAIFNSCDGLGLARRLDDLQIPQMIVMRELIPDKVAQEFLKYFLTAFVSGKSFYLATREARERLQGWESDFPCATWLPVIYQNPTAVAPCWQDLVKAKEIKKTREKLTFKFHSWKQLLLASMLGTSLVMGLRLLGFLQPFELQAYDMLMRSRPDEGQDNRLLLITITENDVQAQPSEERQGASLSDNALEKLLKKLEQYQPRAIGLAIYRDRSVQPQYQDLISRMGKSDRFFAICKSSNHNHPGVLPPPEVPPERLGFNNVIVDDDGILRRHLLSMGLVSSCQTENSLSLQLAKQFLAEENIQWTMIQPEDYIQLGQTIFRTLEKDSGGYQQIDPRGHQIMLNYRSTSQIAPRITLTEALNNEFNPNLIKNRIVLIGTIAPSFNDNNWLTPYSNGQRQIQRITGLEIHAHQVSQILSAVLDKRPLIWFWSKQWETLWIWFWSINGGIIVLGLRSIKLQIIVMIWAIVSLYSICLLLLLTGGWIPLIPGILGLVVTPLSIAIYKKWRKR
ncbi:adenylate cyclase [[Phormidium ambiguum] IAM M-71]|uniref:Adenylate cyclase n=1 Tax=[Phormidium ambiguum] IAM M-71 TaxID=454136 RepID=A0A1U7I415_9CYAN|nr:CHASE2 domain-containing protein [Phormidium ambiguum]OKH30839.1 adenylate cyclase [Phormidium ambiguum IAM M-71]